MCQAQQEVLWMKGAKTCPWAFKDSQSNRERLTKQTWSKLLFTHLCKLVSVLSESKLLLISWIPYQNRQRDVRIIRLPLWIICKMVHFDLISQGGGVRGSVILWPRTCISSFNLDWMDNEKRMVRYRNADRHQQCVYWKLMKSLNFYL